MTKRKSAKLIQSKENIIKSGEERKLINKKGSSLVLALVVIALISILSTLVLSLAMNAYQASVQNKWADEDFYYCEECLDDVYGIVVAVTNDIFLDNYKQVLAMFTSGTPDIINKSFREGIRLDLRSNETNDTSDLYNALNKTVDAVDDEGNVVGELKVFYNDVRYNENPDLIELDFKSGKYVFKDVTVEYRNTARTASGSKQKKFYSSVTTDIVIYIPNLVPSIETDGQGSLSYAIVSGGDLKFDGIVSVSGNVYAGNDLSVNKLSDVNFLSDYITVVNQIKNNGKLSVTGASATANIWCKDLILKENGSITAVAGNMFVNDDLQIDGDNCTVQLSGKYYGYGDGTTKTEHATLNGGSSTSTNSAILVNGEGTFLDMMSIRELVLSGHSFFPVDGIKNYNGAESLATIVSQSIYMVDDDYIDFTTQTVSIGGRNVSFDQITNSEGKTLIDLLSSGYTLITGGVDLDAAKIKVGDTEITEEVFANTYLSTGDIVTLGHYTTDGKNYCSLYWNFASGNDFKADGADIVHESYITNPGADAGVGIAGVTLDKIYVYKNGSELLIPFGDSGRVDNRVNFGEIYSATDHTLTDKYDYTYNFEINYGEKLPGSVDANNFFEMYLNESEPVKAIIIEKETSTEEKREYKIYLQWNFDSSKVANKNAGDAFISACIEAGLVDGFLEKFMDGGYIKIGANASINTKADLYEYIVGEDGYAAKKYGSSSQSLFNSSVYSNNVANAYKWYMTTLVPSKYDPFGMVLDFDNSFDAGEKYSIFTRNSYYYTETGVKEKSEYIDFSTITNNGVTYFEIYKSTDGAYQNLIVNGDLVVSSNGTWTADGVSIDPFLEGIIFVKGNVLVESDIVFNGMIIANGNVEIKSGRFSADVDAVEGCLETLKRADNSRWWQLVSDEFYVRKSETTTGSSSLNAVDCIKYENWTRNRDKIA